MAGSARTLATSALRRSTAALGVLLGAASAFQDDTLKLLRPGNSRTTGTWGWSLGRLAPITPSSRTALALICGLSGPKISTTASIWPPRNALMTAGVPL